MLSKGSQVLDDSAFSDEFCRFLQTSVPSVDAAELLLALAGDPERWRQPADEGVAAHVKMLSQAYRERPVTLFRVIYALRDLKIESFANAFS